MVRYNLFTLVIMAIAFVFAVYWYGQSGAASSGLGGVNMYGFPMTIVPPSAGTAAVPGQGISYNLAGLTLPDFGTTYGFESHEQSPLLGGSQGYFGPNWNGVDLGVSFGLEQANHDASTTAFSKDLFYSADLDKTFIGFPGIGVGSLGVGFPTITQDKSKVQYAESVKFVFSTESDKFQIGGFGYPLGMGLGYSSARVGTDPGLGILNSSFYFG